MSLLVLIQHLKKSWKYYQIIVSIAIWLFVLYFVYYEKDKFLDIWFHSALQWTWILWAMVLLIFNIAFEALKWQYLVKIFYPDLTFFVAFQAILAGNASAFITPQKLGDYVGRLLYLNEGNRIAAAIATFLDRLAQLGATLFFSILAALYLHLNLFFIFLLFAFAILFHTFLWFPSIGFNMMTFFIPKSKLKLKKVLLIVKKISPKILIFVSFLSLLRFTVFFIQYVLIFKAFGVYENSLWALCCATFFLKSFLPSIAFSELGIREGVAIWVFSYFHSQISSVIVFQATFLLFVINTLIPAILGSILIRNLKI